MSSSLLLKKLSDKISEIAEEQKELEKTVEIYRDYADYVQKKYHEKCNELEAEKIKLQIYKEYSKVGRKMYHEKIDELKKVKYDRDYYEKCLREEE